MFYNGLKLISCKSEIIMCCKQTMNEYVRMESRVDTSAPKIDKHLPKSVSHFFSVDVVALDDIHTYLFRGCSYQIKAPLTWAESDAA